MKENYKIAEATQEDAIEILQLYKAHLGGPADWNEYYPNEETIEFDLSRNALFVMKNDKGEIIATISIDEDEEVNSLDCWSKSDLPSAELARLCVREDYQNQGISKIMMRYVFGKFKAQGIKAVHILVKTGHDVAMNSYLHLGFKRVGECDMFDKHFECLEIIL